MKLFDDERHRQYNRQYMGQGNKQILANLKRLSDAGAVLYLRLIMVDGVNTDGDRDIRPFQDWLQAQQIRVETIHLLPYHELGRHKYEALQRPFQLFRHRRPERPGLPGGAGSVVLYHGRSSHPFQRLL